MCTCAVYSFLNQVSNASVWEIKRQYWNKEAYSYRGRPRTSSGLMLLIRGNVKFVFEGGELNAKAGDMIFLPEGSCYEAEFEDEIEDYLVNFFSPGYVIKIQSPTLLFEKAPIEIYKEFERFVLESHSENFTSLKSRARFYSLLESVVKNAISFSQKGNTVIEKAKQLLAENEECSLEEIARLCNVSASGLRKRFKASEGITLAEYRTRQKINRAKYMLVSTNMSITEISDALNFCDPPYFCKIFKRIEGISPKKYAETQQI